MATKFDSYKFMQEVFVYLGQEMKESADITYVLSTRNKFIAEAEALGAGDMIMPNIFPLTGKYASTIEVLQANPSGTILAALEQYFADYIDSRQLPDFDPSTLTAEAKRLAKLFLASITEIAIAILMIGIAHVKLLKQTPIDRRLAFIKAMRRNYVVPFHPFDHTYSAFSLCVSYNTSRWEEEEDMDDEDHGELKLHFIDDANWPKLLSESGKHIVIESLETDDISWEELPRYLKEDIFGDGGW